MALPSSGQISFSDLQTEYGGSNPISMSEFRSQNSNSSATDGGPAYFLASMAFKMLPHPTSRIEDLTDKDAKKDSLFLLLKRLLKMYLNFLFIITSHSIKKLFIQHND